LSLYGAAEPQWLIYQHMMGTELRTLRGGVCPLCFRHGRPIGSRANANISALRLVVSLALILVANGPARSPALADDATALIGRWLVPSREQEKSRMSRQCQQYAETEVQKIPESEIEIFLCDDPAFAPQKARILEFVKSVNEIYRAQKRPLYSETISGLCAVVRETTAKRKTDLCNPSEKLRGDPIKNLPVVWNIRASGNDEWPLAGDSYSPASGYGAISCFKRPAASQVMTKGCRRWGAELPVIGAPTCDCGCEIVCDEDVWTRK
jgi:hypothetical protein